MPSVSSGKIFYSIYFVLSSPKFAFNPYIEQSKVSKLLFYVSIFVHIPIKKMDKEAFDKYYLELSSIASDVQKEIKRTYRILVTSLEKELQTNPAVVYSIITAVLIVFITTILLCCLRRTKTIRNAILMLGLSDSGKTLLFSKLVAAKNVTTYTSMKENVATITPSGQKKKLQLVDIPGNERLRSKYLDQYLSSARGIMFVVDSLNFQKDIRDVASYLYSVLQERFVQKCAVPLLIVCNKQDHAVAKSAKVIQSQLEKEMNALRHTASGQLNATSPDEEIVFLGQKNKDFQFSDLKPIKVTFVECSASEAPEGDSSGIFPDIWAWIAKAA